MQSGPEETLSRFIHCAAAMVERRPVVGVAIILVSIFLLFFGLGSVLALLLGL